MKQDSTASAPRPNPRLPAGSSLAAEAIRLAAPIGILIVGVIAFFALRSLKVSPTKAKEQIDAPIVETVVVKPHDGGLDIVVDGVVVPFREIDLSAEVSGRISKKSEICRAGKYVTRGTPLIEIDSRDYELEVERLNRELAQATVSLEELDVEVSNTKSLLKLEKEQLALQHKELERQQTLAGKRIVTDSDLDRSKHDELAAINSVTTLDNQLRLLSTRRSRLESACDLWRSQLDKAELDLSRTKVPSPIDGVIIKEMVEEDSYVQKGTSLAKLEDTSAVEVKCNLKMEELYWLWAQRQPPKGDAPESLTRDYQIPPAPVTVSYDLAGRRYSWQGVLSRFDGIGVDERTRTVPCRVLVSKPREVRVDGGNDRTKSPVGPPALVRGMYVMVSVHTRPEMTLLEIPQRAVQPGNKVWQVVDGRLSIRRIRVAEAGDDVVLVYAEASSLRPGMKLISSPLASVTDGMAVREREKE
jgi:multidrug efflux pump subunit AcrA (membrane-fusion protein)